MTTNTEEALEEIKAILVKHDLWACVTVTDTERTHWLYHFDASWSCMSLSPEGEVRIRAVKADFATPAQQHEVVQQTVGAVFNTRDFAAMVFKHMDLVARKMETVANVEHHPFTDLQIKR